MPDTGTETTPPELKHVPLDTTHHIHLQHLPPIPSDTEPPHWVPEDTPYRDRGKQYHYLTPIQQLATTVGHRRTLRAYNASGTPPIRPCTTRPCTRVASQHTCKTPSSSSPSSS